MFNEVIAQFDLLNNLLQWKHWY